MSAPEMRPTRSVGIRTLGCRLNQFESDGILGRFAQAGYRVVDFDEGPDIAIINTCTVTDQADARNRAVVRQAVRQNRGAAVIVTGCFAQTDPAVIEGIEGVSLVVGNDRKSSLFDIVHAHLLASPDATLAGAVGGERPPLAGGTLPVLSRPFAYEDALPVGHTRAYLKIQDGCDRHCSYCKIPQARGRGVSRPLSEVIAQAERLQASGVPEIVLTGVNLGWYSDPGSGLGLNGLLRGLLDVLDTARLRISSIEPPDVNAELAEILSHARACPFLHMPLQSGSAAVLRRMRRTYNATSFRLRVEAARRRLPDVSLGTDVIVGFPGETEAEFGETLAMLSELEFANIHPFRFSARQNTVAAGLPGRVGEDVIRERMSRILALRETGREAYARRFVGQSRETVLEERDETGWRGMTDNFLRVRLVQELQGAAGAYRRGQMLNVRIVGLSDSGAVLGSVADVRSQSRSVARAAAASATPRRAASSPGMISTPYT